MTTPRTTEPGHAPGDEYESPHANPVTHAGAPEFLPGQDALVAEALGVLRAAGVEVVLAGAFAAHAYTGVWRNTKDLDLFLRPRDVARALAALAAAGFETELRDPLWLAKAWRGDYLIDLIFGIGNRELQVDDGWIARSRPLEICGVAGRVISIEDLIVSKVFIVKRDRFDGADIAHVVRRAEEPIDWARVLEGIGARNRPLLLWHLLLVDYVYPGEAARLPRDLMRALFEERARAWENGEAPDLAFRGSILDDRAFAIDVEDWGYPDARRPPEELEEVKIA